MSLNDEFERWSKTPPPELDGDPIWKLPAFRIGTFLSPIARDDTEQLAAIRTYARSIEQLLRSVDSIAANIAEGYARYSGRERARFYEIAMGSAREARVWYRTLNKPLGIDVVDERTLLLTRAVRILNKAIPEERERQIPGRKADQARLHARSDHTSTQPRPVAPAEQPQASASSNQKAATRND